LGLQAEKRGSSCLTLILLNANHSEFLCVLSLGPELPFQSLLFVSHMDCILFKAIKVL